VTTTHNRAAVGGIPGWAADEPAGKPVAECAKRTVCLTVHRGAGDGRLLQEGGARAFRQARIPDLCQEALSQGALLTREDLAYRVFFCHPATISRDLAVLRKQEPRGKTTSQICAILHHSPAAVTNYLWTFARCAYVARQSMGSDAIAYTLDCSRALVEQYLAIDDEPERDHA